MNLLCFVLMGETQQSVATYPNQTCDLRRSCTYTFLVFPPAAAQTNRHTYIQTDRQRVTSHCSARIRFVLHGPRFRHFTSQFHCLLTEMGSTQHRCLSVPLLFLGLSFFLSFFVPCTFCFFISLYLPIYSSFPFCLYSYIFLIFLSTPSVCVSLLPYSPLSSCPNLCLLSLAVCRVTYTPSGRRCV